ncbi:MAG: T9SS type A sorting domain-containing protein [Bacteroidetes bacterium]|nr:T9SS type A sorting domain-containing protein [Bacteroidota bacterium]MBS1943150.1 T9SS type A sorting domain-containing protein [Bacteroidota bacterium]
MLSRSVVPVLLLGISWPCANAQWEAGGIISITSHFSAAAFHQVDTGLFVYGSNNPGPSPSATEGGILLTWDAATSGGGVVWYEPSTFMEDVDVKMAGGKPWYIAVGHELYNYSLVVRKVHGSQNPLQFDSVRTGVGRYYRAVRMRNDLVAFAAGGTSTGDGIIDMSTDTGTTWAQIAVLSGQPVSRLHFVNDQVGFAATGGYSRLFNNGVHLPDSGAIYRTLNGGLDWEQVLADTATGFSDVDFLNGDIGVATRNDGTMLRTIDGGLTWTSVPVEVDGDVVMTSVVFRNDGQGFASGYRPDGSEGIILNSSDQGASWWLNYSTAGMNGARRIYDLYFFDDGHGYACAHWKPLVTDGLITEVAGQGAAELSLYPNPATDQVELRTLHAGIALVEVVDRFGVVVHRFSTEAPIANFDVRNFAQGLYFVRITSGTTVQTARLVHM